jgi:hypothetical protein
MSIFYVHVNGTEQQYGLGHAAWTWTWTCSMDLDMDMQHGRFINEKIRGRKFCETVPVIAEDGREQTKKIS